MRGSLKAAFDAEMARYRHSRTTGEDQTAWLALERAHILSQAYAWPHTWVHWEMFRLGMARGNWHEVLGQIPRLMLAAPGSITGRAPLGNTGRSDVGIFTPMPIPDDLMRLLARLEALGIDKAYWEEIAKKHGVPIEVILV